MIWANTGFAKIQDVFDLVGAPDTIRTCGLHLRRVALYPAELRVPLCCLRSAYADFLRVVGCCARYD
jgi:hypothetical protein